MAHDSNFNKVNKVINEGTKLDHYLDFQVFDASDCSILRLSWVYRMRKGESKEF